MVQMKWFLAVIIMVWLAYNSAASLTGGKVVTDAIREVASNSVTYCFLMGLVAGHWWFPRRTYANFRWVLVVAAVLLLIGFDIGWHFWAEGDQCWCRFPGLWVLIGVPAGSYLWTHNFPASHH